MKSAKRVDASRRKPLGNRFDEISLVARALKRVSSIEPADVKYIPEGARHIILIGR